MLIGGASWNKIPADMARGRWRSEYSSFAWFVFFFLAMSRFSMGDKR